MTALINLLSTPGSPFFQNLVLSYRLAGLGSVPGSNLPAVSVTVNASTGSMVALINLLSTPGSVFFQNLVLSYRLAGLGKGPSPGPGPGGSRNPLGLFNQTILDATRALGSFVTQLVSPDTNPAALFEAVGGAARQAGSALALINPAVGAAVIGLGSFVDTIGGVMRAFDGMVERYAMYNPALASAKAQADVTQILGDIRRSQEAAPDLIKYLQQRTELQQKYEDAKIQFMSSMMPLIIEAMKFMEDVIPLLKSLVDTITAVFKIGGAQRDLLSVIKELLKKDVEFDPNKSDDLDLYKIIMEGPQRPGSGRGLRAPFGV